MNKEQLGFGGGAKSNRIKLNEITLDAEDGVFIYKRFLELKNEDGSYPSDKLKTPTLEGVIVAVRRKLQYWSDADGKTYATNEFNRNDEEITFYGPTGSEKGTAESLRKKYPNLKTLAIIYFLSSKTGELVRLNCKGLGLQPEENKMLDYKGLFQYLGTFEGDESPSEYYTIVKFVAKDITKGRKTKTYQAMRFERGDSINDETRKQVEEKQALVLSQFGKSEKVEQKEEKSFDQTVDEIKYPEEEIDIKDIPF